MNRLYEFAKPIYGIDDERGQFQPFKPQNTNNSPIVTNPNEKDVSNSVGVTLNPPQGLLDIYNKQIKLANQQYANQQALAQRNAERERQRLQEQLANQRMDYLRGQQLVSQEGFQRGRGLLNTLADRGLATSGLLQLGDVQNRMAQGATLSALANANAQVQKAGMDASKDISDNLVNQLMQANIQRDASLLNADLTNYELRQGEQDKALQSLLSLVEVLGAEGMDDDIKNIIAQAYQAYLNGDTKAIIDLIGGSDGNTGDGLLDVINKKTHPSLNYTFKISSAYPSGSEGRLVEFKLPNGELKQFRGTNADKEALDYVKNMYKDFPNYDKISIEYNSMKTRIVFKVNNKKFKTYNEANEFIKEHKIR